MIGDMLKRTRTIYGYKAAEMSSMLGISTSYLSEIENNKKQIKKAMQKLTPDLFFDLLKIKIADISALSPEHHYRTSELNEIRKTAEEIIKENECLNISDLSVNGNDLIDIGFTQGKDIGKTLSLLLEEVLSEIIKNEKNILLNRAKEILQKKETDQ